MGDWNRRITPPEKKWTRRTNNTYMLTARIPLDQMERLKAYVDRSGELITDVMRHALDEYLMRKEKENG